MSAAKIFKKYANDSEKISIFVDLVGGFRNPHNNMNIN